MSSPEANSPPKPWQVEFDASINTPADLGLARAASGKTGDPARVRCVEAVVPDVDVMDHAGDLRLAPTLLDVQRADDVGPALTAEDVVSDRDAAGIDAGAQVVATAAIAASQVGATAGGAVCALALVQREWL